MASALDHPCTAFHGDRLLATGPLVEVALAVRNRSLQEPQAPLLVFDDATGRVVDLDLRGSAADLVARLPGLLPKAAALAAIDQPEPSAVPPAGRGRPRLGVVAREVTLLPRHWTWLAAQPGGASAALRRLVDQARREDDGSNDVRRVREVAYRTMATLAGNRPGFEAASRALFAGDSDGLAAAVAAWPSDISSYVLRLAGS